MKIVILPCELIVYTNTSLVAYFEAEFWDGKFDVCGR